MKYLTAAPLVYFGLSPYIWHMGENQIIAAITSMVAGAIGICIILDRFDQI